MNKKEEICRISSVALDANGRLRTIMEQYNDYLCGKFKQYDYLVARIDSKGFNYFDINPDLIIVIRQSVIEKIRRDPKLNKHGHHDSIDFSMVENIIYHPERIIYVIKNNYDNYAFTYNVPSKNTKFILLAMNASKDINRGFEVNDVTSIYGKDNLGEYIKYCINSPNYSIKKVNAVN